MIKISAAVLHKGTYVGLGITAYFSAMSLSTTRLSYITSDTPLSLRGSHSDGVAYSQEFPVLVTEPRRCLSSSGGYCISSSDSN